MHKNQGNNDNFNSSPGLFFWPKKSFVDIYILFNYIKRAPFKHLLKLDFRIIEKKSVKWILYFFQSITVYIKLAQKCQDILEQQQCSSCSPEKMHRVLNLNWLNYY